MIQFLIESVVVTLVGGLVGILIGVTVAFLAALIIQRLGYHWPFIVTISSIILATGITFLIGVFFGLYPARKAAKLNVVEALRYE